MDILKVVGRKTKLFEDDLSAFEQSLRAEIEDSSFLVLGGAGSIGQAVVKEIFKRNPAKLYVVDISENNLVELVRDIRSSLGYIKGDFRTFALDIGSAPYKIFEQSMGKFDYVLNLSALKHVRSEKDPFTIMRMIDVNIVNTVNTVNTAAALGGKKYFAVSTDKAANPVNMMGASKRIMELYLTQLSSKIKISTARFANVAFSDGSLLHGFNQRILKKQPIVAPNDVKRYFVTPQEAGELCLFSTILGENGEIFFPHTTTDLELTSFADIAVNYLQALRLEPYICESEDHARMAFQQIDTSKFWPCLFTESDTTGEKDFEEFYTSNEEIDFSRFKELGIVKTSFDIDNNKLSYFLQQIENIREGKQIDKQQYVELFKFMLPNFEHKEVGKYLDSKM